MSTFIYYQFYVFLATFYGGIIIALVYDMYRVFRKIIKPSKIATIVQDLLFWIIVTAVAISVLLYSDDGKLRGYTILGFILGALIYSILLSEFVVKAMLKIINFIRKALITIFDTITMPIRCISSVVKKAYKKLKKLIRPYYYRLKRILTLPKRVCFDIKKYTTTILSKK